jgi:HEAT repeat protein
MMAFFLAMRFVCIGCEIVNKEAKDLTNSDWDLVIREINGGRGVRFVPLLADIVAHPDSRHFNDALYYLGKIGPEAKAAVPSLISALKTNDEFDESNVAETIGKIGTNASAAVPVLIKTLQQTNDPCSGVKIAAMDALGGIGRPAEAALPLLQQQRKDKDIMVVRAAINALARISDHPEPYVQILIKEADEPQKENVIPVWVWNALDTFAAIGPPAESALPVIIKNLNHPNDTIRGSAIRAAGAIGPKAKAAIPALERTASDGKWKIELRIAAVRAIADINGNPADAETRISAIKEEARKAEAQRLAKLNAGMEQQIKPYTAQLPKTTMVELYAIQLDTTPSEISLKGKTFPVRPYNMDATIISERVVTGAGAEQIAALWRSLELGWQFQALCHEPFYGLRFYSGKKLLLETSVSWECNNFYVPQGWVGFNAKTASGQALFKLLESLLPYGSPPVKEGKPKE